MASDHSNLQVKSNKSRTRRESESRIVYGCNKMGEATQVRKRKRAMDAKSRWKVIETKLKRHNNAIKMAAISRTGIGRFSVEFNHSDLSKESSCPNFGNLPATTMVTKEVISNQQTLKDALGIAMKTTRYAEIISKARSDRDGLGQERERKKILLSEEEKAARRRGAEQVKKDAESVKREREQEREAARVTLEMMKREVELELEDNVMILKELETLSGCSPTYVLHGCQPVMVLRVLKNGKIVNPLEQLGLHTKDQFLEDDDEAYF